MSLNGTLLFKFKELILAALCFAFTLPACSEVVPKPTMIEYQGKQISYETVLKEVNILLRVTPKSKEVLVRWELPIRYFVSGLGKYPEREREFDAIAQQFAEMTGLDIQRHDQIYWPQEGTMHHPDSPDNNFTNAHFFFYPDFESLASESEFLKVGKYLGQTEDELEKRYSNLLVDIPSNETSFPVALRNQSGSDFSMMYSNQFSQAREIDDLSKSIYLNLWFKLLSTYVRSEDQESLHISDREGGKYGAQEVNHFDKLFLKYLYSDKFNLKHGMNNEIAAKYIAQLIWHDLRSEYVERV